MKGAFIVLEGADGTGKTTQSLMLAERLRQEGHRVEMFDFPQYEDNIFAKTVGRFLNGEFGTLEGQSPYLVSMPFAGDRWKAGPKIRKLVDEGVLVISNRYWLANFAHQGAKLPEERRKDFFEYLVALELGAFGIPPEDLNLVLNVPPEISQRLIEQIATREYLDKGKNKDIHEENLKYQMEVAKIYRETIPKFRPNVVAIDCAREDKLLSPDEIHALCWDETRKFLSTLQEGRIVRERQR